MLESAEILDGLKQFHGTSNYYVFPFGCHYTDGIHYLAESAEAYWLIGAVASWANDSILDNEEFLVFDIKVYEDRTALIRISDGNKRVLATQALDFTDFPLPEITIWCIEKIILLPSEY